MTRSSFSVETFTAGFNRQTWTTLSIDEAEAIARKLSVAAAGDPTYPNPFFVVEADGRSHCQYLAGERSLPAQVR